MAIDEKYDRLYEKQLEFLTELNVRTKEESKDIFEKAHDLLTRVGETEEKIRAYIKKLFYIVVTIISFFGTILATIGITAVFDVKDKYDEFVVMSTDSKEILKNIKKIHSDSRTEYLDLKEISEEAKILKEIFLEIRSSVEDIEVYKNIKDLNLLELNDARIRYNLTIQELWEYIEKADKYNYLIVFEAIKNYKKLINRGEIKFDANKIYQLIKASVSVLNKCDVGDWRTQYGCRNFIIVNSKLIDKSDSKMFVKIKDLLTIKIAGASNQSRYKWNLVIAQSNLGIINSKESDYLDDYIKRINSRDSRINEPGRTWLSCVSAMGLIKNKRMFGWEVFSKYFKKGTNKQIDTAALVLSPLGRNELESLGINENLDVGTNVDKFVFLTSILQESKLRASDNYSNIYFDRLIKKLNIN